MSKQGSGPRRDRSDVRSGQLHRDDVHDGETGWLRAGRSSAAPDSAVGESAWLRYQIDYNRASFDTCQGAAMLLVTPEAVAAVMELQPVPHTLAELEALVRDDLPKSAPSLPSSSGQRSTCW